MKFLTIDKGSNEGIKKLMKFTQPIEMFGIEWQSSSQFFPFNHDRSSEKMSKLKEKGWLKIQLFFVAINFFSILRFPDKTQKTEAENILNIE